MPDFVSIKTKINRRDGSTTVYPEFLVKPHIEDLMVKGHAFYAIWDENKGSWSTNESTVMKIVDNEISNMASKYPEDSTIDALYLRNFSSNKWLEWQKYVKSLPDNFKELDGTITFANSKVKKTDYRSKRLSYDMAPGDISAYDELMDVLYSPEERQKLEWSIGSIINGDSKKIQKFIVLYGEAGSGKSTFLNIVQSMFDGYWIPFNAKELGSNGNSFAMEQFKDDPLIAIQHDGDLSKIEDNTLLNSIISHETLSVNEKFKSKYKAKFRCFLYLGTNRPVKITEAKSGIIRRLIDVTPTGKHVSPKKYNELMSQIKFEYGAIAQHCYDLYTKLGRHYYDSYRATSMIGATNDFYNFVEDECEFFERNTEMALTTAWTRYKQYCDEARVPYPMSKRVFKEELKNYYSEFHDRYSYSDGTRGRSVYIGFMSDKFLNKPEVEDKDEEPWLKMEKQGSIFDIEYNYCKAQYATAKETPKTSWDKCNTLLAELTTSKLHYVKVPENLIVIDFDIKDEDGKKCFKKNFEEALKWPPTYAEKSKGGEGIHLHYIYDGDVSRLNPMFGKDIEVKVFTGGSSLRRRLSDCNNVPIARISSGLPLKEVKEMISDQTIKDEKELRAKLKYAMNYKVWPNTKPSVDYISKIVNDAYEGGISYDITNLYQDLYLFAKGSHHQADKCVSIIDSLPLRSKDQEHVDQDQLIEPVVDNNAPIAFFDVEVFPNLFIVCYKIKNKDEVVRLINPTPENISELCKFKLIGFNNRKYDNHILYARLMGYSNLELYKLSQDIVNGVANATFPVAYNLSYTDVYDFSSVKQSLKKFEIELGIGHIENEYSWDQPLAREHWDEVANYCANDVRATEAVFENRYQDFVAREVLSSISGLSVNCSTRQHATKIIFGDNKHPDLVYTDLSKEFPGYRFDKMGIPKSEYTEPSDKPGWKPKSIYMGCDPSEGGYVKANPGIYYNVALLDVESLHPHTIKELNLFGSYTQRFVDILDARLAIKHGDFDKASKVLDGAFKPYLTNKEDASKLQKALKIIINSVYGYTSATFDNPFKDERNVDNIVAKRGALFMIKLRYEVEKLGYTVVHIKTDSIKIADADDKIIKFCTDFGKQYGYTFDHEATFEKICLVNDSTYICKVKEGEENGAKPGEWSGTGTQFKKDTSPYVFKKLFSHEPIEFKDVCVTKSVTSSMYLDLNEGLDGHHYRFIGRVGSFVPVKEGYGGGYLYRLKDDKYSALSGTLGQRWLESSIVNSSVDKSCIDYGYFDKQVDKAIKAISKYGDFEEFVK